MHRYNQTTVAVYRPRASTTHIVIAWIVAVLSWFYMLPWAIAATRSKQNLGVIVLINVLLGWTFVGWFAALVMACLNDPQPTIVAAVTTGPYGYPPAGPYPYPYPPQQYPQYPPQQYPSSPYPPQQYPPGQPPYPQLGYAQPYPPAPPYEQPQYQQPAAPPPPYPATTSQLPVQEPVRTEDDPTTELPSTS